MIKNQEQVQISKLVFTHNWEDPQSDYYALKIEKNNTIMAITSGGCNVLGFLLHDPKTIYAVDINLAQTYLLQLKIAAIKALDFDDFIGFSGLVPHPNRNILYHKLKHQLSAKALVFFKDHKKVITNGFIMNGKYEGFVKFAGKFLKVLQGRNKIDRLFKSNTIVEQENYFDNVWNTKRFKYLFKILFNKRMLAKRGLVADYFHFDDGSKSFAESFYKRSKKAFRDLPIKGNYFVSLYILGKYRNSKEVPEYLKRENYALIKARVNRIKTITAEAQEWIDSMENESIDCFALSNICELMSNYETKRLFEAVKRTATPNARVIFRNLMIPREVPEEMRNQIVKNEELSQFILDNDRSFVYGKVAAYTVLK